MCFCRSTLPGALVHNFTRIQAMTAGANGGPLVAGAPCPGLDANGALCSGIIAPIPTRCRLLHEFLAWKLAERSLSDDVYNELLVDAEALLRLVANQLGFDSLKAFMTSARSNALSGAASVAIFRKMLADLADETARERERIVADPQLRLFAATPPLELAGLDELVEYELPTFFVANYPKFGTRRSTQIHGRSVRSSSATGRASHPAPWATSFRHLPSRAQHRPSPSAPRRSRTRAATQPSSARPLAPAASGTLPSWARSRSYSSAPNCSAPRARPQT